MALSEQLSILAESLKLALDSLPSTSNLVSEEGISLLSTKNELLLSYLQNLVLLILLKIRGISPHSTSSSPTQSSKDTDSTLDSVIRSLVALRIYLEKGIRPLESRLKYQLEKLLAAANESISGIGADGSTEEAKPAIPLSDETSGPIRASNPDEDIPTASKIAPLAHRPNPASLLAPQKPSTIGNSKTALYRPPQITPTSLASPHSKKDRFQRGKKSATLEEFVREEMGDAPVAEPSIGAGSGLRGKALERERERTGYEEGRLVRLPSERGKKKRTVGGEEILGGGGLWDGVDLDLGGAKRVRREGKGTEEVLGERWEKRKKRVNGSKAKRK